MFSLDDAELEMLVSAAKSLPPQTRAAFVAAVATEVAHLSEVGPGALHRAIAQVQRRFLEPPVSTPRWYR